MLAFEMVENIAARNLHGTRNIGKSGMRITLPIE